MRAQGVAEDAGWSAGGLFAALFCKQNDSGDSPALLAVSQTTMRLDKNVDAGWRLGLLRGTSLQAV